MPDTIARIPALDALRGIAALVVVVCHFSLLSFAGFFKSPFFVMSPLHWSIEGHTAVLLFFILSGFVLGLPFQSGTQFSYGKFLIRRFCRIYIPFVVSVIGAALLWFMLARGRDIDIQWNGWGADLKIDDIFLHLLATGMTGSDVLNPPIWALFQEMRVAIIFPVLICAVRKVGLGAVVMAVIGGALAAKAYAILEPGKDMFFAHTFIGSLFLTLFYIQFFIMGIYLALYREQWTAWMDKLPPLLFAVAGGVLFLIPLAVVHVPFAIYELYQAGIGVFLMMACLRCQKVGKVLLAAPLQWLGKISYSLYLTHAIVMMAMIYAFYDIVAMEIILGASVPVIFLTAHLMQKYVELPALEWGRKLTSGKIGTGIQNECKAV